MLYVYTLKNPEKQTDHSLAQSPAIENMKPFLALLLGVVGGMMAIAVIIVVLVRIRGSSGHDRNNCVNNITSNPPRLIQSPSRLARSGCNDNADSSEKNPDIIPHGPKHDENQEDEKFFEWMQRTGKTHSRMYATTAVAEQNALNDGSYKKPALSAGETGCMQQFMFPTTQTHQHQSAYNNGYNTLIPMNKIAKVCVHN